MITRKWLLDNDHKTRVYEWSEVADSLLELQETWRIEDSDLVFALYTMYFF